MPPKVERCVDALLNRKTFKPKADKKERESSAWAICQAATKTKNEYIAEMLSELPLDIEISLSEDGIIQLSEIEGYKFDDEELLEVESEASDSTVCSMKDRKEDENTFFTFSEVDLARKSKEDKEEMEEEGNGLLELEVLREGKFEHPWYGELDFNKKYFMSVVQNFLNNVIQREVSFDSTHRPVEGATAWVKKLGIKRRMFSGNGVRKIKHVLTSAVDLTDWGRSLVESKQFKYFSSEVDHNYIDRETKEEYGPTMLGGGLTNRPFITGMLAVQMSDDAPIASDSVDDTEPGGVNLSDEAESGGQFNNQEEVSSQPSGDEEKTELDESTNTTIENAKEKQDRPPDSKLPDAAFALVKTVDGRKQRALPHHGPQASSPTENSSVDLGRLRNALARINQVKGFSSGDIAAAQRHLDAHAKALLKTDKKAKASTDEGAEDMNELKERITALEGRIASLDDTEKNSELGVALQEQLDFLNAQLEAIPAKLEEAQQKVAEEFQAKFDTQTSKLQALETQVQTFEVERYKRTINDRCDALIRDGHYPAAVNKMRDIALSMDMGVTIKMSEDGKDREVSFVEAVAEVFSALPEEAKVDQSTSLSNDTTPSDDKPADEKKPTTVQFGETSVDLLDPERINKLMAKVSDKKPAN